ncbi:Dyp-type peroxidase, partial [Corynebacterium diphtheriae]
QEKSLDFEPQPKSSMNNYNQFKTTVLQPPIESKQFIPIQQRLDASDRLNEWIKHIGSAVYAIFPGTDQKKTEASIWGAALFDS